MTQIVVPENGHPQSKEGLLEFQRVGGGGWGGEGLDVLKAKFWKEKYESKLEFPRGCGMRKGLSNKKKSS